MTADSTPELRDLLRAEVSGPVEPQIAAITSLARTRYGHNACAVMFYGSCLRRGYQDDDVVDLYLIVDRYGHGPVSRLSAFLNWLLPPNVVYLETKFGNGMVRAKCAIISLADFERGVSGRWFHSYMWARFAQPCRLAYVRDDDVMECILGALEGAAQTMVREVRPLMSEPFDSATLWRKALEETYGAELRAERPGRASELISVNLERYNKISALLCEAGTLEKHSENDSSDIRYRPCSSIPWRLAARIKWFLRRIAGKVLSVLRLMKAAFTFDDGAVYILWKIERHCGVSIDLTDWQRRHPILASTTLFWRLYRKGAFK
jgi:hypothetical protein